jgi:hypothetical protein
VLEVHVIRIERIGQHDMTPTGGAHEIRQIIVVSVAVVNEAALLNEQTPRIGRGSRPGVPSDRPP